MKTGLAPLLAALALPCAAQVAAPPPPLVAAPASVAPAKPAPTSASAGSDSVRPPAPVVVAAASSGAPKADAPPPAGEPEVRHTVIEGETTRIDELRVRGVARRIVVTTKGRTGSTYEIITGDGSRDLSDGANTSRGAAGKRVWRVLDF
jgi:hypothetical protein